MAHQGQELGFGLFARQCPVARLGQPFLGGLAVRNIPDMRDKYPFPRRFGLGHRNFDREFAPCPINGNGFDLPLVSLGVLCVFCRFDQPIENCAPNAWRLKQLKRRASESFIAGIPEQILRGCVHLNDVTVVITYYDRIGCGFDNRPTARACALRSQRVLLGRPVKPVE